MVSEIKHNDQYIDLLNKLDTFIRKYYKNKMYKGLILAISILLASFILVTILEYFGHFSILIRTFIFYSYILINLFLLVIYVLIPVLKLYRIGSVLSHKQASEIIGKHFPDVNDKLLNTLQLKQFQNQNTYNQTLVEASIQQKTEELKPIPFLNAINLLENKKYLKYAIIPLVIIVVLLIGTPKVFTESSNRIVKHNEFFEKPMPFSFSLLNNDLTAIKGEDFKIKLKVDGESLPAKVYIQIKGSDYLMQIKDAAHFNYTVKSVREAFSFKFVSGDFASQSYKVKALAKPELMEMKMHISYPLYIGKADEIILNSGDLTIAEGSTVRWEFMTKDVENLFVRFSDTTFSLKRKAKNKFEISRYLKESDYYQLTSSNKYLTNKDTAQFYINIIPDAYPRIYVQSQQDSLNEKYFFFAGNISDDYGLSKLTFNYKYTTTEDSSKINKVFVKAILISNQNITQEFYHSIDINDLGIKAEEELEYYFEVWDNDGIHGKKSSTSQRFYFVSPSKKQLKIETEELSDELKEGMRDVVDKAKKLQEDMKEAQKKLVDDKQLEWEDKQFIEKILEEQKALEEQIEDLKKKYVENVTKQDEYKDIKKETLEKYKELYEKFEQLIPQELKDLYEELEKLMDKNLKNEIQEELEKFNQSEKDIEKELDRMLELYKRLEFEQKTDEIIDELEKLAEKQDQLSEENPKGKEEKEQLQKDQEELNEEFKELEEEMDKLEELNKELENPNEMEDMDKEQEEIKKEQEQSLEEMKEGKQSKSSKNQKNAAAKMKELAGKMKSMKMDMEMKSLEINYEKLRRILENLMYVSFEQEKLIADLNNINTTNPRYIEFANQQKKLKDDMRMIEDSLFALSKELPMIAAYVNKEVNDINYNMEKVVDLLSDRFVPQARGKQQYAMTSMNNVALMLSELLKQMQQEMTSGSGKSKTKKPGKKKSKDFESLRQMQESLNKQLKEMKDGKPSPSMSKQMAQMAAKQEMLRNALRKMDEEKNKDGTNPFGNLSEIQKLMEETEEDIVNKNITEETLKRQKEIEIRLIEAEKAEKEQGKEEKRESKSAREMFNQKPPSLEEYIKSKEKEIELLQNVPPNLTPYYRIKVKEYFRILSN